MTLFDFQIYKIIIKFLSIYSIRKYEEVMFCLFF